MRLVERSRLLSSDIDRSSKLYIAWQFYSSRMLFVLWDGWLFRQCSYTQKTCFSSSGRVNIAKMLTRANLLCMSRCCSRRLYEEVACVTDRSGDATAWNINGFRNCFAWDTSQIHLAYTTAYKHQRDCVRYDCCRIRCLLLLLSLTCRRRRRCRNCDYSSWHGKETFQSKVHPRDYVMCGKPLFIMYPISTFELFFDHFHQ